MDTYWINVRTGVGTSMRVTVDAPNQWQAMQQLRAMYGSDKLIGEAGYENKYAQQHVDYPGRYDDDL